MVRATRKKILIATAAAILLVTVAGIVAAVISVARNAWIATRQLTAALDGAREVVLIEYVEDVKIARKVATPDEVLRLRQAVPSFPRPFESAGSLCFEPHHEIEVLGANGSKTSFNICFLCEELMVSDGTGNESGFLYASLPAYLAKPLASFFTSVGMSPKTDEEYTDILVRAHKATTTQRDAVSE